MKTQLTSSFSNIWKHAKSAESILLLDMSSSVSDVLNLHFPSVVNFSILFLAMDSDCKFSRPHIPSKFVKWLFSTVKCTRFFRLVMLGNKSILFPSNDNVCNFLQYTNLSTSTSEFPIKLHSSNCSHDSIPSKFEILLYSAFSTLIFGKLGRKFKSVS